MENSCLNNETEVLAIFISETETFYYIPRKIWKDFLSQEYPKGLLKFGYCEYERANEPNWNWDLISPKSNDIEKLKQDLKEFLEEEKFNIKEKICLEKEERIAEKNFQKIRKYLKL